MADVNDTNGLKRTLERVIDMIDTADVDEDDRDALRGYATWKRRRAGSLNTARTYIRDVTLTAERHDVPITQVDSITEVERIIDTHEQHGCTAAKSINLKLTALRDFWRWCEGTEHGLDDYRWVERVKGLSATPENPGPELVDPGFVLTGPEITRLREAADNLRDKALIEFLADTGVRITLATQMLRGSVDVDATPPTFQPNPEGVGHKGVATKDYVLHESTTHLRRYLKETHPDDHPDAPLFALRKGYDPDERQQGAIAVRTAFDALAAAADAAGIDRERAHPHNLRKSAVVRMRLKHDMSWDAIQKRTDWSDNSLANMKQVYRRITNQDEIDMVARELGYSEIDDEGDPVDLECWNCGRTISASDSFCGGCGVDQDGDPVTAQLGRSLTKLPPETAKKLLDAVEDLRAEG